MTEAKPTTSTDARPKIEVVEKAPKKGLKVEIITEKPPFFSAPRRFAQTMMRAEARLVAVAGGALALGAMLGFGAASRDQGSATAIASLATAIESGRSDTAKLAASLAKLDQNVGELRTVADSARKESGGKSLNEKIAQLDRSLTAKLASLNEKIEQAEKEHAARIASLTARPAARPEPTQTGSLAEPRDAKAAEPKVVESKPSEKVADIKPPEPVKAAAPAKPTVLEHYAVRDVFEGAAIIENRGRRLFQVMPGDTLPGAGRVEAIERKGRQWVVVTRQGLVTPQEW